MTTKIQIFLLFILSLFFINYSYAKDVEVCDKNGKCYKTKAQTYANVKFIKYNITNDTFIMQKGHASMNVKASNIRLNNVKSKDIKEKNKALKERKNIQALLKEAKKIDLKNCIFTGYYSCEIYLDSEAMEYMQDQIID